MLSFSLLKHTYKKTAGQYNHEREKPLTAQKLELLVPIFLFFRHACLQIRKSSAIPSDKTAIVTDIERLILFT